MIRLLAIGDAGDNTALRRANMRTILRNRQPVPPDGVLVLGDNFYDYGVSSERDPQWTTEFDSVFPDGLRYLAILGNHDYLGDPCAQVKRTFLPENTKWFMPHRYYHCNYTTNETSVDLFMLDTFSLSPTESYTTSSSMQMKSSKWNNYQKTIPQDRILQLDWLKTCLAESKAQWKVVCGHYPIFSDGGHGNNRELQHSLLPIFQEYNVDLYLCGHDHNLQDIYSHGTRFLVCGSGSRYSYFIPYQSTAPVFATGIISLQFTRNSCEYTFLSPNYDNNNIQTTAYKGVIQASTNRPV